MWLPLQLASVVCWAIVSIIDSVLVRHWVKHPLVLGWSQSCFSLLFLFGLATVFEVKSSWISLLIFVGMISFLGDIVFWRALNVLDVSITNIAWALLSVFLTIGGFFLFQESWSLGEWMGVLLILGGVSFLSVSHQIGNTSWSLLLLPLLAFLNVPFYLTQKAALLSGEQLFPVFFWPIVGREMMFFSVPWFFRRYRQAVLSFVSHVDRLYHLLNAVVVTLFFAGMYLTTLAFMVGPVSLVSTVSNVQPFVILFIAWLAYHLVPSFAPRELLTAQSVQVKLLCFSVVFLGLALLAVG